MADHCAGKANRAPTWLSDTPLGNAWSCRGPVESYHETGKRRFLHMVTGNLGSSRSRSRSSWRFPMGIRPHLISPGNAISARQTGLVLGNAAHGKHLGGLSLSLRFGQVAERRFRLLAPAVLLPQIGR